MQDIVFSLILGLSPSEAFASLYLNIIIGVSAKETAQILHPVITGKVMLPFAMFRFTSLKITSYNITPNLNS